MSKIIVGLFLVVFLCGCSWYTTLDEGDFVFIDYPERQLVLVSSVCLQFEKVPDELKEIGYDIDDFVHVFVGDSISVVDEIDVEPEIFEGKGNDKTYKVYRYYPSEGTSYLLQGEYSALVFYVDMYVKESIIKILKVNYLTRLRPSSRTNINLSQPASNE